MGRGRRSSFLQTGLVFEGRVQSLVLGWRLIGKEQQVVMHLQIAARGAWKYAGSSSCFGETQEELWCEG